MNVKQLPAAVRSQVRNSVPKELRVTLPAPPSVNNLFANVMGKGRIKTREYRDWLATAESLLLGLESPASYPCCVYLVLQGEWDLRRDGDNVFKSVIDAAKNAGVIPSDSLRYVVGWHGAYRGGVGNPEVVVWFEELRG